MYRQEGWPPPLPKLCGPTTVKMWRAVPAVSAQRRRKRLEPSTDVMRPSLLLCVLIAACGVQGRGTGDDEHPPLPFAVSPFPARVEKQSRDTIVVVRIGEGRRESIDLSPPAVPDPLQPIVRPSWRGTCAPEPGGDVLISVLDGRLLMLQRKRASRADARERPYDLCAVRTYFDVTGVAATPAWRERMRGLGLALGGIATYDVPARIYIRGEPDTVLMGYRTPADVEWAARRYGQPRLAESARQVAVKRAALRGRTVLAEVMPIRYTSPSERPVGSWGYFVVRLFEERGAELVTHVDHSAAVSP